MGLHGFPALDSKGQVGMDGQDDPGDFQFPTLSLLNCGVCIALPLKGPEESLDLAVDTRYGDG